MLGIVEDRVLLFGAQRSEPFEATIAAVEGANGTLALWSAASSEVKKPGAYAVALGDEDAWLAIDANTQVKGTFSNPDTTVSDDSPTHGWYVGRTGLAVDENVPHLWVSLSPHTYRTPRDVIRYEDDYASFRLVSAADQIVAGATSADESTTCVTVQYEEPTTFAAGEFGVHCIDWSVMAPETSRPTKRSLLARADAMLFPEPISVISLEDGSLAFIANRPPRLLPLREYRPGLELMEATATQCGIWATRDEDVFFFRDGEFQAVPIKHQREYWFARNIVFGRETVAALFDGVLTYTEILSP